MTLETQICRLIRHEGFLSWYMNGTSYKNRNMLVSSQNKVQKIKKWKPKNKFDFSWKIDFSGLGSWPHWQLLPKYGLNIAFHEKTLKFLRRFRFSRFRIFRVFDSWPCFVTKQALVAPKFNINRCSMKSTHQNIKSTHWRSFWLDFAFQDLRPENGPIL